MNLVVHSPAQLGWSIIIMYTENVDQIEHCNVFTAEITINGVHAG